MLQTQRWDGLMGLGTRRHEIRGLHHGKPASGDLPSKAAAADGPKDAER